MSLDRPSDESRRIALSLSGGGFRATLFHVGALQRLNECGVLRQVSTLCSVSGGSITNGVLATRWNDLIASVEDGVLRRFEDLVAAPIYDFCRKDLRTQVLLWDRVNPVNWPQLLRRDKSATDRLASAYAEELGLDRLLSSLPSAPEFCFLATNISNGGPWEFRAGQMGDWYAGYASSDDVSVAAAVAASSSYPVTFPPLRLTFDPAKPFRGGRGKAELVQRYEAVTLTDGGVYDNLGLEPVRNGYDYVLVSDAGHPLIQEEMPELGPYARVTRSLDITANQVGAQRRRWLIEALESKDINLDGAYWGLRSRVANFGIAGAPSYGDDVLPLIEQIRTDLDPFTDGEIGVLVNHGYALANVALQRWTRPLLPERIPKFAWPFPDFVDDDAALAAVNESSERGILRDIWMSIRDND